MLQLPPILENPHFYLVIVPVLVVIIVFLLFRQSAAADISTALFAILASASKIVFITITVTACTAFMLGKLEDKYFMVLAGMVFTYYFNMNQQTILPPRKEPPAGEEPPPSLATLKEEKLQDLHALK